MAKFYAAKGEENQIFTSWDDCKFFIDGKKGYKYKSFSTREEAQAYLDGRDYYKEIIDSDLSLGFAVAFTDGSFEENVGRYSYGVIAIDQSGEEFSFCGSGNDINFIATRNVAGEVEGVLTALEWAFINGYTKLKIYHDYEGLATWYDGRWGYSSPISTYYVAKLQKYKGVLDVTFQKVTGHSNNKYNDLVDKLAKEALFDLKTISVNGIGYKFSGTSFIGDFITWYNKKLPKAKVDEKGYKTTFTLGENSLSIYSGLTASAIVSDNERLHALSITYFLDSHNQVAVNRLIERLLGVIIEDERELDGYGIAKLTMGFYKKDATASLLFALWELENFIRRKINAKDKISPYFVKTDNGFSFNGHTENKRDLEKAYTFFFKYRTEYFNLNLTSEEVLQLINKAEQLQKGAERNE